MMIIMRGFYTIISAPCMYYNQNILKKKYNIERKYNIEKNAHIIIAKKQENTKKKIFVFIFFLSKIDSRSKITTYILRENNKESMKERESF